MNVAGNNSSELEIFIQQNSPLKRPDKKKNVFLKFKKKFHSVELREKESTIKLQENMKPTKTSRFTLHDIRYS